jgi:hypothetical protein
MKHLIRLLLVTVLAAFAARATTLLVEPFAYADGTLTAVAPANTWTNHSGTGTFIQIVDEEVSNLTSGSGSREDVSRGIGAVLTNGVVFAGFDLTVGTPPPTPTAGDYFLHFANEGTGFRGRVFVYGAEASGFRVGLENDGGSTAILTPDLPLNTQLRVVLAYDISNHTSRLWVDSADESIPTLADTVPATAVANIQRIALRQGSSTTFSGVNVDNLIVATTFVEAVPEPSVGLLLGAGALAFWLRRRR